MTSKWDFHWVLNECILTNGFYLCVCVCPSTVNHLTWKQDYLFLQVNSNQGYGNRYNCIYHERKNITFICFENRSLIKQQLPFSKSRQQYKFLERCSELKKKYISDVPSENFVFLTIITATTLSINEIIPVSIAFCFLN